MLNYELLKLGLYEKEKALPLIYEDIKLDCGYRIDLMIDNRLTIETKLVENDERYTFSSGTYLFKTF